MSDDPQSDPFAPPEISTEVCCLHCGETYDSWQIEWRVLADTNGEERGFWCCPIDGCNGMGFGFDILPTDPEYQDERGGWVHDDSDEDDDNGEWSESDESESDEEDAAWLESGELTEGATLDEVPWDDSPPEPPSKLGDDFPFSVN